MESILKRFAPESENDTKKYIEHVCKKCEMPANVPIDFHNPHVLMKLGKGIILHENGEQPYEAYILWRGLRRAYTQVFQEDIGELA